MTLLSYAKHVDLAHDNGIDADKIFRPAVVPSLNLPIAIS